MKRYTVFKHKATNILKVNLYVSHLKSELMIKNGNPIYVYEMPCFCDPRITNFSIQGKYILLMRFAYFYWIFSNKNTNFSYYALIDSLTHLSTSIFIILLVWFSVWCGLSTYIILYFFISGILHQVLYMPASVHFSEF